MEFEWKKIKKPLLEWYNKEHRDLPWRQNFLPYFIWISEIMLQQTRVEAVKEYYNRFISEVSSIEQLAAIDEERLLKLWEGLGYYNRAKNLKKAAEIIVNQYDGCFPIEYEEILQLPGIGEYTASAICSICYDACTPAVDGNVMRVVMRLLNCFEIIDDLKTKRFVRQQLYDLYTEGDCGDLTQAFMELGATICIPNGEPKCMKCPLSDFCKAYQMNSYSLLPVRKKKKVRKRISMSVFILCVDGKYAIQKRKSTGLLADMWEFLHVDQKMKTQEVLDYLTNEGFAPVCIEKQIPYTHIFSHVEWDMTGYYITCRNRLDSYIWVTQEEFETKYALPTAFRFYLDKVDD